MAMGMEHRFTNVWSDANQKYLGEQQRASDVAGGLGALSKALRMVLQSTVLALGAYLVIQQEASGGIIIASSILSSRALAPVELAIANWRGLIAARQGWTRLAELFRSSPLTPRRMNLPAPRQSITVENIYVVPPGAQSAALHNVSFEVRAGHGVGIIGPSASGKSSLVRAIVRVWSVAAGEIRLDGATLDQWDPETLGVHLGYLPQDFELFGGTVAQNIARFEPEADAQAILAAAMAAGVHDLILRLPNGYDTDVGESGTALSAGQRQRIALARALYGNPFLVVLDEPNSNLDAEGEQALTAAITGVRARGGIVMVVAHRPSALNGLDQVLMMEEGRVQAFGKREEVLRKVLRPALGEPIGSKGSARSTDAREGRVGQSGGHL